MSYRRESAIAPAPVPGDARQISFILSTGGVARDGHTIAQNGWDLGPYLANPIVTFAHDTSSLPIGRMVSIGVKDGALRGTAQFADADANPQADCVYRLLVQKFLNACSISWDPLELRYATGPGRAPGAIDFIRQQLLECAVVPVPSDPACLVTARSRGIDTRPIAAWADRQLAGRVTAPVGRQMLEAISRSAGVPRTVYDLAKKGTPGDRSKLSRFMAFDAFRRTGAEIPAAFLPAQTRDERAMIVEGMRRGFSTASRAGKAISEYSEGALRTSCENVRAAHEHLRSVVAQNYAEGEDPLAPIEEPGTPADNDIRSRSGKVISGDNEALLTEASAHLHEAHRCMQAVLAPIGAPLEGDAGEARAARARRVQQLGLVNLGS